MEPFVRTVVIVTSDHVTVAYIMAQTIFLVITAIFVIIVVGICKNVITIRIFAISRRGPS
jgi:hypothetical protein